LAPLPGTLFFVLAILDIIFLIVFFLNFSNLNDKKKKYLFLASLCLQGETSEELDP